MRLVLVSDTHGLHRRMPPVPDGDVLVHAGDLTSYGTLAGVRDAVAWLAALPHRHKVCVAGNHDWAFERHPVEAEALVPPGVTYLRDRGATLGGVRFWGSPWQPEFNAWAFNLPRGAALARVWARIPDDVQVLVTHGPPFGVLDRVDQGSGFRGTRHVGCEDLARRVAALPDLRVHVFGHVHEGYGMLELGGRRFVNASTTTVRYEPVNAPVVVDL